MEYKLFIFFGTFLLWCSDRYTHAFIFDTIFGIKLECSTNSDCSSKQCDSENSEKICESHHCKCHRIPTTTIKSVSGPRACVRDADCSSWYCDSPQHSVRCLHEIFFVFPTEELTCCCAEKNSALCNERIKPKRKDVSSNPSVTPSQQSTQKNIQPSFFVCESNDDCSNLMCTLGLDVKCFPNFIPNPAKVCLCATPHNGLRNTSVWPVISSSQQTTSGYMTSMPSTLPRWSQQTTSLTTNGDIKTTIASKVASSTNHPASTHSRNCRRDEDCSSWHCDSPQQSVRCLHETFIFLSADELTCCCTYKTVDSRQCIPNAKPKYKGVSTRPSVTITQLSTQKILQPSFYVCKSIADCSNLMCNLGLDVKCLPFYPSQQALACLCADPDNGSYNSSVWPFPILSHTTISQTTKDNTKTTSIRTPRWSQHTTPQSTGGDIKTTASKTTPKLSQTTVSQTTKGDTKTSLSSTITTSTTRKPTTLSPAPCTDASDCTAQNTQAIGPFGALPCTAVNMRVCSHGFCSCNNSFSSSTTSMKSTAAITSTSNPVSAASCYQCGSEAYPCSAMDLFDNTFKPTKCDGDKPFCMTDIGHHDAKLFVYKRCVDESTCRRKWLQETSDLEYCINLMNKVTTSAGTYECHFCCHGDGCNSGITPPNNKTMYLGKPSK